MRILVISNGHGEDAIAAEVIRRLPPELEVAAYPTLGAGLAYRGICPIVGPRRYLPSEGQRRRGSLLRDLRAGLGIGEALRFMRGEARTYDAIMVVGDILGVAMCWWTGNRVSLYLDVYKSGFANDYSGAEKFVIRRSCDLVLTRDEPLAASLRRAGVNARFAGNVLMDTLTTGVYDARARRTHGKAVAILPGSRSAAAHNFGLQVAALRLLPDGAETDLFAVVAPGSRAEELAAAAGLQFTAGSGVDGDLGTLIGSGLVIHLATGALGSVIEASDLVLGQGGTANLQALGLGKPVVSFLPREARSARRRRISALTGDSRIVVEATPEALAEAVSTLLKDETERLRRGALGRERIGPGGAIDAIVETFAGGGAAARP